MARTTNIASRLFPVMVVFALAAAAMSGCIREQGLEDCPPPVPPEPQMVEVMVVTAFDLETKEYITISERIVDGSLYFFNSNVKAVGKQIVEKQNLGKERPIPALDGINPMAGDTIFISAWGNIAGNLNVMDTYAPGQDVLTPFLHIIPNTQYTGYYMCPGELLFGMRRIIFGKRDHPTLDRIEVAPDGTKKLIHEIQVQQVNALLSIHVEGLPDGFDPDDYYFRIVRQNSGYDYQGLPFAEEDAHEIREVGISSSGYLITEDPYNLIPSIDPQNINEQTAAGIHLYKKSGTRAEEDIDLTGEVRKVDYGDGAYIALHSTKTTNVYIKLGPGGVGVVEVRVKLTDWGDIYQWTGWG